MYKDFYTTYDGHTFEGDIWKDAYGTSKYSPSGEDSANHISSRSKIEERRRVVKDTVLKRMLTDGKNTTGIIQNLIWYERDLKILIEDWSNPKFGTFQTPLLREICRERGITREEIIDGIQHSVPEAFGSRYIDGQSKENIIRALIEAQNEYPGIFCEICRKFGLTFDKREGKMDRLIKLCRQYGISSLDIQTVIINDSIQVNQSHIGRAKTS